MSTASSKVKIVINASPFMAHLNQRLGLANFTYEIIWVGGKSDGKCVRFGKGKTEIIVERAAKRALAKVVAEIEKGWAPL